MTLSEEAFMTNEDLSYIQRLIVTHSVIPRKLKLETIVRNADGQTLGTVKLVGDNKAYVYVPAPESTKYEPYRDTSGMYAPGTK